MSIASARADAFAAGVLHGLGSGFDEPGSLDFGIGVGLPHAFYPGDFQPGARRPGRSLLAAQDSASGDDREPVAGPLAGDYRSSRSRTRRTPVDLARALERGGIRIVEITGTPAGLAAIEAVARHVRNRRRRRYVLSPADLSASAGGAGFASRRVPRRELLAAARASQIPYLRLQRLGTDAGPRCGYQCFKFFPRALGGRLRCAQWVAPFQVLFSVRPAGVSLDNAGDYLAIRMCPVWRSWLRQPKPCARRTAPDRDAGAQAVDRPRCAPALPANPGTLTWTRARLG